MDASWAAMAEQFAGEGLPPPPVPPSLRTALRAQGAWCWSTRPIDPFDMYMFGTDHRFILDLLYDRVADYVAISHAGHGINSYAINFHLVHRDLAVLMQVGFGGVYMDNERQAEQLAGHWARIDEMLATPPGPRSTAQQRLVIIYSSLRPYSGCGWIRRPMTGEDDLRYDAHTPRADPFDRALRLWQHPDQPEQPDPPA